METYFDLWITTILYDPKGMEMFILILIPTIASVVALIKIIVEKAVLKQNLESLIIPIVACIIVIVVGNTIISSIYNNGYQTSAFLEVVYLLFPLLIFYSFVGIQLGLHTYYKKHEVTEEGE